MAEKTELLATPPRAKPSGPPPGVAHAHEPEAYSADLTRRLALPVGLVALAVFLWWATDEGGYAPTIWYPGAAVFLVLFLGVLVLGAPGLARGGWPKRAWLLFAAFTVWSFLSIVWAGVKGEAWDGANRTLLYLTVFSVFAFLSWRTRDAGLLVGLFAVGTAAIGAAALATGDTSAFVDGRLAAPTGYANANAALFLAAFWPAVSLAARAEVHWAARGVLLAASGVLLQLAVLAQSRGSFVAGIAALAVYVLLSERRARSVLVLVPVAAVTLGALDPLLSVFASSREPEFGAAVAHEQQALALSAAALLALGAVIGALDRPGAVPRRLPIPSGRGRVAGLAAIAVLATVAAGVVFAGLRSTSGGEQGGGPASALESSRFGGLESGRFDMWRVAAGTTADRPLLGAGADNFAVDFARERHAYEEPLYPHSVLLRAFSQTGLVGGALFVGFLAAAFLLAGRTARRSAGLRNAVAAGAIASASYWLVHGSLDWFWEIPVLAAPALAFLGLAAALEEPVLGEPRSNPLRSLRRRGATALLGAAALASYAFPGAAAWQLERAVADWPSSPERALARLDSARRLNPASERPDVVAGTLLQRAGQNDRARASFERALDRNPHDWYAHLRLALLDAAAGRRSEALAGLGRAEALNPLEPTIEEGEDGIFESVRRQELVLRLDRLAVRGPLGRRPLECRPVLGIAASCGVGGSP